MYDHVLVMHASAIALDRTRSGKLSPMIAVLLVNESKL